MGRAVRDHRLENRSSRSKLAPRKEPYWRLISEGLHLGYYRGKLIGKWVCRFRQPGEAGGYAKITLGEADDVSDADGSMILTYHEALQTAEAWYEEQKTPGPRPGPLTVGQVLDEYLFKFAGKGIVDTRSRVNAIIRPVFGHVDVRDLTTKMISDWHAARGKSPAKLRTSKNAKSDNVRPAEDREAIRSRQATANRDLTVLKAALNKAAIDRKWMRKEVWGDVKPFQKVDVARRRYLTSEECAKLISATDQSFRDMVKASLLTGGRYGELRHALVCDYDRESATLWLAETKDIDPRPAYLDSVAVAMIEEAIKGKGADDRIFTRPDGLPWGPGQQRRRLFTAFRNAEIPAGCYRDLRRSYGARLARQGVPLSVIAEAMGHADERITRKHYAHLAPTYVSSTIRAAIGGLISSSEV